MKYLYLILIFVASYNYSFSQNNSKAYDEKSIQNDLKRILAEPTNAGKDFWLSVPPALIQESSSWVNYTRFFIIATSDANVRLEQGTGISQNMFVPAGAVRAFNLTPDECQPFLYNYNGNTLPPPAQVYTGKGIHITSDQPVIVYVVIRYKWTSDGYLAIPTQSLGTKYISSVYDARPFGSSSLPNMHTIVGAYDNTKIKVTLGGGIVPLTVQLPGDKEIHSGEVVEWIINKGDVIVISNKGPNETLSGSLIEGNKPFASISGQFCTDITVFDRACDYTVEMDLPLELWGQIYPITLIKQRKKPPYLRVFAKDPNTIVYRDGQELFFFTQGVAVAGGTQNNAWVEQRVWPAGLNPTTAVYTSDKPIYVCLYNPSQTDDNTLSDPFTMIQTPIEQYQNEITFSTPAATGGRPFKLNWLNIVMEADENGLVPEDMEFGRVSEDGTVDWKSVRSLFGINLDLYQPIGTGADSMLFLNSKYRGKVLGQKNIDLQDGVYSIRSSKLFTCYSYGYDEYDSYGYPLSNALKILDNSSAAPIITMYTDCNGNLFGSATDGPDKNSEKIREGLNTIDVDWNESFNIENFKIDTSFKNGDIFVDWTLNVKDKSKQAKVTVSCSDLFQNKSTASIYYKPEKVDLRELATEDDNNNIYNHSNGKIELNYYKSVFYEIQNMSSTGPLVVKDIKFKSNDQNYSIEPLNWSLNTPFSPKEVRKFIVTFHSNQVGKFTDSIGVETECNEQYFAKIETETSALNVPNDYLVNTGLFTMSVNPNPVATQSVFTYELNTKSAEYVNLQLIDLKGNVEANLFEGIQSPGSHSINLNATNYANGQYYIIANLLGHNARFNVVIIK